LTSLIRVGSEAERGESIPGAQATPTALYWEGNDGTRIQMYRPYDYGDFADFEFEFPGPRAVGEGGRGHRLALYGVRDPEWESAATGSIAAPAGESFEPVERDRRPTGAQSTVPVVRFASPERALAAIREASGGETPTAAGEIAPPGAFSMPSVAGSAATHADGETAARIRTESLLQTAEAVSAVAAGLPGAAAYPGSTLEWIWRELLEAAALSRDPSGMGATDMARHEMLASASNTADSLVTEMLAVIRAEMETDAEPVGAYVLFNPLAHVRRGVAFVEIGRGGREDGARSDARDLILVNIPEIPALGAIALPIGADGLPGVLPTDIQPPAAGDLWLENAFLRVEIDPSTGAISSILDKTNRRQALSPGGRANVLIASRDSGTRATSAPGETSGAGRDSVRQGGPVPDEPGEIIRLLSLSSSVSARAATVTITRGWNGSQIRQQLVLARAAPFLEIRSEVRWNDAGWRLDARFDPVVEADSAYFGAPYGAEPRAARSSIEHPALHWVDVSDGSYGVAILAAARDAWKFDGSSISLRLPTDPVVTTRFAIYPHAGDGRTAGIAPLANEYVVPLLAALEPPHGGRLGRRFSLASSNSPTVSIEWVKRAEEDDDVLILRLVERSGRSSEAGVGTACPEISAWRANHLEEPIVELPSSGGGFRIRLRGNEIATVRVTCRE
jgi:alpha-mannosidase